MLFVVHVYDFRWYIINGQTTLLLPRENIYTFIIINNDIIAILRFVVRVFILYIQPWYI